MYFSMPECFDHIRIGVGIIVIAKQIKFHKSICKYVNKSNSNGPV